MQNDIRSKCALGKEDVARRTLRELCEFHKRRKLTAVASSLRMRLNNIPPFLHSVYSEVEE